jgi:hypothetical protein
MFVADQPWPIKLVKSSAVDAWALIEITVGGGSLPRPWTKIALRAPLIR